MFKEFELEQFGCAYYLHALTNMSFTILIGPLCEGLSVGPHPSLSVGSHSAHIAVIGVETESSEHCP